MESTKSFKRDEKSGALINVDHDGLAAYRAERNRNKQISKVTDDINSLKSELFEIKEALKLIIELKK